MYRTTIFFFLSETPIENSKENSMLQSEFKEFMIPLSKDTTNRTPSKRVVLIDATTNTRSEIDPSKQYVLKHVPVTLRVTAKAKSERIKHMSNKPDIPFILSMEIMI